jgi:capsular exopolysaccharide synthesis family protein
MKKRILNEIRRLLENEIIELRKTRQLLGVSIGDIKKELKRLADTNRDMADLQRQIDIAETTYMTLAVERDSALTAAATNYSNATIITWAELPDPGDPYYPKPALYIILAVILGLMFGFGMAFVVEFMDISVKSIDDIKGASDLTLLGVIPKMRSLRVPKIRKLDTPDKFAGAIMEIKHNVLTHLEDKKIIAVASALKKEGKTKLITHLAVALADRGHRVALVDLNLKNPALHSVFNVPNERGVSDILLQENEVTTEIGQTHEAFPQLSIFPAGPKSEGLLHKLGSPALQNCIESLGENYDYVLLDAAALDCFAGGSAVAALAQCALFVVSIEGPSPKKLKEAVNALESAGVEITGVVANRV